MASADSLHPNPIFERGSWQSLNGQWEFEEDNSLSGEEHHFENRDYFSEKINVPFCPESRLSGIEDTDFINAVWYKRSFILEEIDDKKRVILHFGAVDYRTKVWINGNVAGRHSGGYTPFSFDITEYVHRDKQNDIVVFVEDDTRNRLQPTGKQCQQLNNRSCMYTRTTGIWQTVWLEFVPETYISKIKLTPHVDKKCIDVLLILNRSFEGLVTLKVSKDGESITSFKTDISGNYKDISININDPLLWSVDHPNLYDLDIYVGEDHVSTYFGMRKINLDDKVLRINDVPVFQRLVLDQGFYKDGIYTAPTDDDLKNDIIIGKKLGFNGARMHMKVFDPRYIYWADRLGYMLWGEYPNWGLDVSNPESLNVVLPEWIEELERDYNHPSIIGWCPFNEVPAVRRSEVLKTVFRTTKLYDPYRPVIDVSGYTHTDQTDIYDVHDYCQDVDEFRSHHEKIGQGIVWQNAADIKGGVKYNGQPYMISEFGGAFWNGDDDHLTNEWGYGDNPEDMEKFYSRYEGLVDSILENEHICGFCYTQLYDVFQEKNGLYTFDRKPKFDDERIKRINIKKAKIEK